MTSNLTALHEKAKSYDWDYTSVTPEQKFATKFKVPKKGKDPFRVLVRDYMKMEAEKDDRTHALLDGAVRRNEQAGSCVRLNEVMKPIMPMLTNAEYQAVAGCGMIISAIDNQELRQGYHAQMLDEVRHSQLELSLRNYYAKHAPDPAGWDLGQKGLYQTPAAMTSLAEFQSFNTGDPLDCVINLNIVVETGYTNILLAAMPQVAVANGDTALADVSMSIQSDESRHMANGYGGIMMLLSEEENVPILNKSLNRHFWHSHRMFDALVGFASEYCVDTRLWSYKSAWEEWVVDDFFGNFLERLKPFGVEPPSRLQAAAVDTTWGHHSVAQALGAIWPLNMWRMDTMKPKDFEWFENNYPGWSELYQPYWEGYDALSNPANGRLMLQELPGLPPICSVCMFPCVFPRMDINDVRILQHEGRTYATCSEGCEFIFTSWPEAYKRRKTVWDIYHGWDLADVILDMGLVRPDGRTLIGQPSQNLPQLWTIDDIRAIGYEIRNPLAA